MKDLPIKRTMVGFVCITFAIAPAIVIGFFVDPGAGTEFSTEAISNMFKVQSALGMGGLGLLASAFDKYEKLVGGNNGKIT